jgi:RluA family pseudouridine synthase
VNAVVKLSSPSTHEFWEIPVLFEDEHLLALDKPAGLLTSPDRADRERPSLMHLLHRGIADGKPWARERRAQYLMQAYRLDFEASGVLLLAKTKPVLVGLADLFGSERPCQKYCALVQGAPGEDRFEMEARLAPHPVIPGFLHVDSQRGRRSRTLVRLRERFSGYALLQCEPLTNRPHQIRAHLRHAGLPLVADEVYGGRPLFLSQLKRDYRARKDRPERPLIGRPALHAEELCLPHPVTDETLVITAPWPKDLRVAVKYLRQYAGSGGAPISDPAR